MKIGKTLKLLHLSNFKDFEIIIFHLV